MSKFKVLAGLVSSEPSLLGQLDGHLPLCLYIVFLLCVLVS